MYVQLTSSVHGVVAALKYEAKTRIFILKSAKHIVKTTADNEIF